MIQRIRMKKIEMLDQVFDMKIRVYVCMILVSICTILLFNVDFSNKPDYFGYLIGFFITSIGIFILSCIDYGIAKAREQNEIAKQQNNSQKPNTCSQGSGSVPEVFEEFKKRTPYRTTVQKVPHNGLE